jgi:hypothetical protein
LQQKEQNFWAKIVKEDGLGETDGSLARLVSRLKRIRFLSVGLYEVGVHHAGNLEGRRQSAEAMKEAAVGGSCGNMQRHNWQLANSAMVGVWNMRWNDLETSLLL